MPQKRIARNSVSAKLNTGRYPAGHVLATKGFFAYGTDERFLSGVCPDMPCQVLILGE